MSLLDLLGDTLRSLWAHKLRAGLTMFGIAWGIVSMTLMVGAGEGLRVGQAKVAATLGKDLIIVWAGRTSLQAGGTRAGRQVRWQADDYQFVQEQAPDCKYIMPEFGKGEAPVRSAHNSASLLVTGSLPEFADLRSTDVALGRFYNHEDDRQRRRVAFLGSDAKKQLFGDRNALGETFMVQDYPYTVVGVMRHKEQDSSYDGRDIAKIFVPFHTILHDFPEPPPARPDQIDRLLVAPKSVAQHDACKAQVARALGRKHQFDPADKEAIRMWDTLEEAAAFRSMTDGMKYFLGAMGITTLFLGGLGVMNVMLVAVRERTREIGVRKAVGATAGSIQWHFFLEALFVVLLSGAVGLAVAFGLCALVNQLPMPPFFAGLLPTWEASLLSLVLLGVVALGSSLYPARQAARVDPIEALRHEAGG